MPLLEAGFIQPESAAPSTPQLIHFGPTVDTLVEQPSPGDTGHEKNAVVPGLIDTGATECCIDMRLAQSLGLPVIDVRTLAGAGGAHEVPVVLGRLTIPSLGGLSISGQFCCVHLADGGQPHQVLLGRTFLQYVIMIYDGVRGHVTVAR